MDYQFTFPNYLSEEHALSLSTLVNDAYLESERVFWGDDYERISKAGLEDLVRNNQLCVVYCPEISPVGCIKVQEVSAGIGEFGMMGVHKAHRGKGLAKLLFKKAMEWCFDQNFDLARLQLLLPVDFIHEDKERLKIWYANEGFSKVADANFGEYYPHLLPILKIPCRFEVWERQL